MPLDAELNSSDYYFQDANGSSDSEDDMDPDEEPIEVDTDVIASVVLVRPKTPVLPAVAAEDAHNSDESDGNLSADENGANESDKDFPGYPEDDGQKATEEVAPTEPVAPSSQPGILSRVLSSLWPFSSKGNPPKDETTTANETKENDTKIATVTNPEPKSPPQATSSAPKTSPRASTATTTSLPPTNAPTAAKTEAGGNVQYNYYIIANDPAMIQSIMSGNPGAMNGIPMAMPGFAGFGSGVPSASSFGAPPPPPMMGGGPPPPPPPGGFAPPVPSGTGKKLSYMEERNLVALAQAKSEFTALLTETVHAATRTKPENQEAAIKHWLALYETNPTRSNLILNSYGRLLSTFPSRIELINQIVDYWEGSLYNAAATQHELDEAVVAKIRLQSIGKLVVMEIDWHAKNATAEELVDLRSAELARQQVAVQKMVDAAQHQNDKKDLVQQLQAAFNKRNLVHTEETEEESAFDDD